MPVPINEAHMIPIAADQAVRRGWLSATDHQPKGVTWHWTAGWDLAGCRRTIGGANAARKGKASAHYGVGRSLAEGIDRYVSLDNRSWHAGVNQTLRWDGRKCTQDFKGSRATIGIETVNIGFARPGIAAADDWIEAATPNGKHVRRIQPWTDEQVEMMIQVGKEVIGRWPHISPNDHHGHHDVCPGYKEDVIGFPFAQVLRGIYDAPDIPDIWSRLWLPVQRQRALVALGYDLGRGGPNGDGTDGDWGRLSDAALVEFQEDRRLVVNGMWTSFVSREIYAVLQQNGLDPDQILT
jgi:N-acetyl-anhydromuramyl-L-alanine amidase AmpD